MPFKPIGELFPRNLSGGQIEHQAFLLIDCADQFPAVQQQEHFHRGVCDPLVAVDERVVQCQGEAQGRGLLDGRWVQIDAAERRAGLCQGRFEAARGRGCRLRRRSDRAAPDAGRRFRRATNSASGEAPVELLVLVQNAGGRRAEFCVGCAEQIGQCRACQFLGRQSKRLASSRSFSACACGSSKASFMRVL